MLFNPYELPGLKTPDQREIFSAPSMIVTAVAGAPLPAQILPLLVKYCRCYPNIAAAAQILSLLCRNLSQKWRQTIISGSGYRQTWDWSQKMCSHPTVSDLTLWIFVVNLALSPLQYFILPIIKSLVPTTPVGYLAVLASYTTSSIWVPCMSRGR